MPAPTSPNSKSPSSRPGGRSGGPGGRDGRRDNRRGGGRQREPSEYSEITLSVDRVTRVVKGGRRMRFRAIVVTGNKKGKVGLGTGKATEVQVAVKKAASAAKRAMIRIPIVKDTIPHSVELKFKAARIRLMPALPGTGIIAGGALRVILDQAGVKNVLSKRFGTRNKLVNAQAAIMALEKLRSFGNPSKPEAPAPASIGPDGEVEEVRSGGLQLTELTKEQVQAQRDIHRKGKIE